MQDTVVSVKELFNVLTKHWFMVLVSLIAGLVLAAGVTFFVMKPEYESSSLILVNQKQSSDANLQYNQVQTDLQMINTYKDIITKPVILGPVTTKLKADGIYTGTSDELSKMISLSNNQNSQVINVTAKADNPYLARSIANEVSGVFKKKIASIMTNAKNVSIISKASLEKDPVSPRIKLNLLVGAVLGILVGFVLAFVRELTDKTVKDTAFVTDTLGLPLLGTITDISTKDMKFGFSGSKHHEHHTHQHESTQGGAEA